ncbi:MAG: GTP-binding protein [Hyphomicrobiaceae bacterium]|nr:GTP-binding protein [Hyphomicrobiaceae bacterium]
MRIILLFGFLGSGKTTLAQRILEQWGPKGKLALIVNEFGDVGVDGEILKGNGIDLVELSSGCLCCTLRGSLLSAVEELSARKPLEHIVIEATGVAEPEQMLEDFADPAFRARFEIGPITTVLDAPKYPKIRGMLGEFFDAQVEKADIVVLNKIDLADAAFLESVREEVRELNPDAVLVFAERGDIDLAEIMQGPPSRVAARYAQVPAGGRQAEHAHDHAGHDHAHGAQHAPADSLVVDVEGDVRRPALQEFFARSPPGLWRAKGFLRVDGQQTLVQYALSGLELTPAATRSRQYLVLIGKDLDRASLTAQLEAIQHNSEAA